MKKLIFLVFFIFSVQTAYANCGILPIKPVVPFYCTDVIPVCLCDEFGQNCYWIWQCVQ